MKPQLNAELFCPVLSQVKCSKEYKVTLALG